MNILTIIIRTLMGAGFIFFGLNIIHPFLPIPPMSPETLTAKFMVVMVPTHYMFFIGLFHLFGGLFVILGRTAPIGLVLLGPVLVNILAFHVFLQGGAGIVPGLVFSAMEIFLIYSYRKYFSPIFTFNAQITR